MWYNRREAAVTDSWEQRLRDEYLQLGERIGRLDAFLAMPCKLPPEDVGLLFEQRRAMGEYRAILATRLKRLG